MKNLLIYIIIGFFVIILAGVVELKYLSNLTEDFISFIDRIDNYENSDKKREEFANFHKEWDKHSKILTMFIDHQDIHKIESILVESEMILKNNLSSSQISTNFALLKLYIKDITDERMFILQNIL